MTRNISNNSAASVVLIADDLSRIIETWTMGLADYGIEVVAATSLEELDTAFAAHRHQIAAVILDGCMPGDSLNTLGFIRTVRAKGFTKPIVAASSLREYRDAMVAAGCSHQAPKDQAVRMVADVLSTP